MSGMLRTEAVAALARVRGDLLTVVTMRAVEPWNALGQADERNFNVTGCMGSAASVGLGLALAQPNKKVMIIDGDGSLLMQLASLVSISDQQPLNLYHVVMENGVYETSGSQALPGRSVSDLTAIAKASGYREARRYGSTTALDDGLRESFTLTGPVFISLHIGEPGIVDVSDELSKPASKPQQIENMRAALST